MGFDIDTYARIGGKLDTTGLELEAAFRDQPLDAEALRCLRYMHDIESHTVCYLRDILVTKAHRDPDLTAFLTIWNYEEHWHGNAIAAVLAAHGGDAGRARVGRTRGEKGPSERLRPIAFMAASAMVPDISAIHMTWGAVNEWTTQAGYARLVNKTGHPILRELLGRIMKQEGRHIDFYASEANRRLAGSRVNQRVTRFALRHFWSPVGTGVRPRAEVEFVVRYLFEGDEGRAMADRIDRRVDRLPGLGGLALIRTARDGALAG